MLPYGGDVDDLVNELPPRIRLVVLFGGQSPEHDVSRRSAREVVAALDPRRYDIHPVAIARDGRWMEALSTSAILASSGPTALPDSLVADGPTIDALPTLSAGDPLDNGPSTPLVVLPVLHGPNGEDGSIQGLLQLAGVPFVGSGVLGSAAAMDKSLAKELIAAAGIPQARWRSAPVWELDDHALDDIANELGYPLFVKPANMGSSIGVTRAGDWTELGQAVTDAARFDEWLVFEEAVVGGRELEIGLLGNTDLRTSAIGEIIPGADFYDYADKYTNAAAKLIVPADLPATVAAEMATMAITAFRALRAEVLGRADFFLDPERGLLFNEMNTLPGCTPVSMFPVLWEHSGLHYPALLDELVRLALDRHERQAPRRRSNAGRP